MVTELESRLVSLRPVLLNFTHRFTSDRDESNDLVQETLLKALTQQEKFRANTNLKGWLYTIMKNIYLNQYRKSAKIRNDSLSQTRVLSIEEPHSFRNPEGGLRLKEVWRHTNAINPELLRPFRLYLAGYKYHEIARLLGIPLGTVKNRIFQARKEIQKNLVGYN